MYFSFYHIDNEMVYKRMSASREENVIEVNKSEVDENLNKSEDLINMMKKGEVFTKYGRHGEPHPRIISISPDLSKITWKVPSACSMFTPVKQIEVIDVNAHLI